MWRTQVTHFSLIENSFGNLHHLPAYPAGPWGWVYLKELSSFVFYTGTRSIRNDAHGRKMAIINPQNMECRCCTTQLMAEQSTTNAPAKTFWTLDLRSKPQCRTWTWDRQLDTCSYAATLQIHQLRNVVRHWESRLKQGRGSSVHVPSFGHLRNRSSCSLVMEQSHCNAMRSLQLNHQMAHAYHGV